MYRDDNMGQAQFVKEKVLDDLWWDKINYIIALHNKEPSPIQFMT